MNCESVSNNIPAIAANSMDDGERMQNMAHIDICPDCRMALRGAEALVELRRRDAGDPPGQLFEKMLDTATTTSNHTTGKQRFWLGAGFGGAIAASLFTLALVFGWADNSPSLTPTTAEFVVALNEPRQMNVVIETDQPLLGATITILLSGNVELVGYGPQRELTWAADLDAGVNRLSLPIFANGASGGQMVVRLSHPQSEQIFLINLPIES